LKTDRVYVREALSLARRGFGTTSPNPMVGAILVKAGAIIGRGWHRRAGGPHAEIEALLDAQKRGKNPKGATFYVTLEPCCTHGRTQPCTDAIIAAGIKRVLVGTTDPNPQHCGRAFGILRRAGISVTEGLLGEECERLNEAFNHWIVHRTPFVIVKAAMTLDGKIATAAGESKWITGEKARNFGMKLRQGADAILVGINTVLADDPGLTFRKVQGPKSILLRQKHYGGQEVQSYKHRRIILDARARTPLTSRVVSDEHAASTTIVVSKAAPKHRVAALAQRVKVLLGPERGGKIDLRWVLKKLGSENVTSLLVEGGGEVNASFLLQGLAQRVAFFYAPKILGGRDAHPGVGGEGVRAVHNGIQLKDVQWRRLGPDLLLSARILNP
jgi:diaminohydroxyphosphoribosylaminopyrimidine deaminase/5-amino-6-(5-phosphoribosylamino)uracil reductase